MLTFEMTHSRRSWRYGFLCTAGLASLLLIPIASAGPPAEALLSGRWYTPSQVELGLEVYQTHCAVCDGAGGGGAPKWEQRDFLGFYPPPPLNGSGHSAHHPLGHLLSTVATGGASMGGTMPAFGDVLDEAQVHAVIAYIQSLWPDEVYAGWTKQDFKSVSH